MPKVAFRLKPVWLWTASAWWRGLDDAGQYSKARKMGDRVKIRAPIANRFGEQPVAETVPAFSCRNADIMPASRPRPVDRHARERR